MEHLATYTTLSGSPDRVFLVAAIAAFMACFAVDASAANERSDAGTVTNNQTYNAGNYYGQSSAERSNVHLRPLAIDPDHNAEKESRVNVHSSTTVTPGYVVAPVPVYAPARTYVAPNATIVGTTRVYNTEPTYMAPAGIVTTTTHTTPAWIDPADVNARPDAGVISTYPVMPAPGNTVVTTQGNAVIGGY